MIDEALRSSAGAGGIAAPQVPGGSGTIDPAGPRIVRNADVAIEVGDGKFGGAFDRVNTIATAAGGYVTSSSTASTGEAKDKRARSGQLTVRVPSERFQEVRTSLAQLGEVEHESISGNDVSGQIVDYDARLRSLAAQEESLRVLVGKATNVGEVLAGAELAVLGPPADRAAPGPAAAARPGREPGHHLGLALRAGCGPDLRPRAPARHRPG